MRGGCRSNVAGARPSTTTVDQYFPPEVGECKSPRHDECQGLCFCLRRYCYLAFSRISTSRQRLVADNGRVSIRDTRSPIPAMPFSSCAFTLVVVRMILP